MLKISPNCFSKEILSVNENKDFLFFLLEISWNKIIIQPWNDELGMTLHDKQIQHPTPLTPSQKTKRKSTPMHRAKISIEIYFILFYVIFGRVLFFSRGKKQVKRSL
jgi:hypothetical protein